MSDIRSDTIKRSDAIKAVHDYWKQQLDRLPKVQGEYGEVIDGDCDSLLTHNKELSTRIKALPSADRPKHYCAECKFEPIDKRCMPCSSCTNNPKNRDAFVLCEVEKKGADDDC